MVFILSLLLAVIYLAFISLGLPDGLLGAAWPSIYPELGVPVSWAGIVSTIICLGTIVSSLCSDRLNRLLGTGRVTAISVAATALALLGFAGSRSFAALCLWAVPYGLGAGSVDAALNNFVALHYTSRHMSWLHCMWGVGAAVGPYAMAWALTGGRGWNAGYRVVGVFQVALTIVLLCSLPLWKAAVAPRTGEKTEKPAAPLSLREVAAIPGAKAVLGSFFCYSAIEATGGMWAASYLTLCRDVAPETAAAFASLFYIGITVGRAVNGFLAARLTDTQMIALGEGILAVGMAALLLPLGQSAALAGLILAGLGCAPIYPCTIHSTPAHFGAERSQAIIGVQMACAYTGSLLMPPLFGLLADRFTPALYPFYLAAFLAVMTLLHRRLARLEG